MHGAVIAAAFDQVFNVAHLMAGSAGPTAELTIRYRHPTPIHAYLVFEAHIETVEGRKIRSVGSVRSGDEVTVEATGLFIAIDPERSMNLRPGDDRDAAGE